MTTQKPRTRLYLHGQAVWRRTKPITVYCLPQWQWVCIACGRTARGPEDRLWYPERSACANGHAPCSHCGKQLPLLACGCPREHDWRRCPGKTSANAGARTHTPYSPCPHPQED